MISSALLRTAVSALRGVFRPAPSRSAAKASIPDPLRPSGRAPIVLRADEPTAAAFGSSEVSSDAVIPEKDLAVSAEARPVPAVEVRAAPAAVEVVDYDTPANRRFGKDHPRYAEAGEIARNHVAANDGGLTAREIADHVRGAGGVPEFMVPAKSLSNRLVAFGLVRSTKGGASVWRVQSDRRDLSAGFGAAPADLSAARR